MTAPTLNPSCVMLAAGESLRMGRWKMTLPWGNHTIIEHSILNAQKAGLEVILVSGHLSNELEETINASSVVDQGRLRIIRADNYKKGMFASARAGFAAAAANAPEWCFLSLGDMPLVEPEIFRLLVRYAAEDSAWHTAVPQFRGKKGHPVILDSKALSFAAALTDDDSMRDVISAFPSLTVPVDDRGILDDVDTPEDYREFYG